MSKAVGFRGSDIMFSSNVTPAEDYVLCHELGGTVNLDDYSSLQYFQKVLRSSGIIDKLEEMGIQEGDTVNLYGFEFDFVS